MSESTPLPLCQLEGDEVWLPIPGYEGYYEVSDYGRIRSLDRIVPHRYYGQQTVRGQIMTPSVHNGWGHLFIRLHRDGRGRGWFVHQLVALAFIGPCPEGMETLHGPGGKLDNRPSNLSYNSHSQNMRDTIRDGTNFEKKKTHCQRNHPLVAPNLVPKRAERGHRVCLACSRAKASVHNARVRHGITLDFLVEADRHYERIMAAAA